MTNINKLFLKRKYKKFIYYYLQHVCSSEKYKNHIKELSQNVNSHICSVEIFDVVDNNGMNKIVSSIHKLDSCKFDVKNYFKKPGITKLSYVQMEVIGYGIGLLADVGLKEDKFIEKIKLSYTQIDNQHIIVCYKFLLRKELNYLQEKQFIWENIHKVYKGHYQDIYDIKQIIEEISFIEYIEGEFLRDIFQSYLTNIFFTDIGQRYKLPILFYIYYDGSGDLEKNIKEGFLLDVFYNKKDKYYLSIENFERKNSLKAYIHFKTKTMPNSDFIEYFYHYGNEFYYFIFENIECMELDLKIRKYLNNKGKFIKEQDCRWIINKLQAIKDTEISRSGFHEENVWECYKNGEIIKKKFINYPKYTNKYKIIYKQHLQYINSIFSSKNNFLVLKVSILALVVSIISAIISYISLI